MTPQPSESVILTQLNQRRRERSLLPVLIESESGRTWTAGDLMDARDAAVKDLDRHPIRPGDRIAIVAEPCGQTLAQILAAWTRGAIVVPMLPNLPDAEASRLVQDAGARLLIDPQRGAIKPIDQDREDKAHADPDTAILFYTSGTSGTPKGVPHTHAGLLANIEALRSTWALSEDDRLLSCLPWNHVHGLWVSVLGALVCGFPIVQARRFPGVTAFYDQLARYRPTLIFGVPTFWSDVTTPNAPRPPEPSPLRLIVSGSAALPTAVRTRVREHFGLELLERYGMTEAGVVLSQRLNEDRALNPGMAPLPGIDVRVTGEMELEVRGPSVTFGYWRKPEATATAFRVGWMRTGDLVARIGAGYAIIGRTSADIMKVRGFKVAALEIEQALLEHPDVAECVVVGIPDERLGERIVALVVLRDQAKFDEERLRAHLVERLEGSKIPQQFVQVSEIPRTPVGKISKGSLREQIIQLLRGETS